MHKKQRGAEGGAPGEPALPSTLGFFGNNLSGQIVHIFTAGTKDVNPVVPVQYRSIWPCLEAMRLFWGQTLLERVTRNLVEFSKLTLDQT
ncbi:MAG: hypothetical protein WAL45_20150 [Terracidiphilus sp.]